MSTPEDKARIAARYPKRRASSIGIVIVGLALTVFGIVWLLWTSLFHANPAIVGAVQAYEVTSDDAATALVKVQRNAADVTGTCTVIAQAVSFERVGELDVHVPAGEQLLTEQHITIRTVKRATSVSVLECRPTR